MLSFNQNVNEERPDQYSSCLNFLQYTEFMRIQGKLQQISSVYTGI